MDARPVISVVIPCHNAARTLEETLESVFAQRGVAFEVIAVNDASTDGTGRLLERHGARLRRLDVAVRGAGAARNAGAAKAQGDYLQFLDADDLLLPDTLQSRLRCAEREQADVVYADWAPLEERAAGVFVIGTPRRRTLEMVDPDPEIATFTDFWSPPAALMYRRALFEKLGGFSETLQVGEDARLLQDAALAGARFIHLPEIGAHYRVPLGVATLSRRDPLRFALDCLENARQIEAIWRARGRFQDRHRAALARVYRFAANGLLMHADREHFYEALAALERVQPGFSLSRPKVAGLLWRVLPHAAVNGCVKAAGRLGRLWGHVPA